MKLPGKGLSWKEFLVSLKSEYKRDKVGDAAGSLTFFGVLALFPFLLFVIALASVIIDPTRAQAMIDQLATVVPPDVHQILSERLRSLGQGSNPGLLSVGAAAAIWSASGGMVALSRALNTAYDVEEGRSFFKLRGVAIGMTFAVGLIALVATAVMVGAPALGNAIGGPIGTAIRLLRFPVAGLLMMFLWSVIYYALPDVKQKFKFVTPGSVFGVLVWLIASWAFSLYVNNFGKYDATYGSIGGVIVLLLWMWISAQVLLVGAEANALIEHRSEEGKRPGAKSLADTGAAPPAGRAIPRAPWTPASTAPSPARRARAKRLNLALLGVGAARALWRQRRNAHAWPGDH